MCIRDSCKVERSPDKAAGRYEVTAGLGTLRGDQMFFGGIAIGDMGVCQTLCLLRYT